MTIIDAYNPLSAATTFTAAPAAALPTPQTLFPSPTYPYYNQPQYQQPAPAPATNAYQPLPRAPGIKTEELVQIITGVLTTSLQPLFMNQQHNQGLNHSQFQNQNTLCAPFICNFCRVQGHGVCTCNVVLRYMNENKVYQNRTRLILADSSPIPHGHVREYMKDAINCHFTENTVRTQAMLEIVTPDAQAMITAGVNMHATIQDYYSNDKEDTEILALRQQLANMEAKKCSQVHFNGIELTSRKSRPNQHETALHLPAAAPAPPPTDASTNAPRPATVTPPAPPPVPPAQATPPVPPHPAAPAIRVTRNDPKQPDDPAYHFAAPIEDCAVAPILVNCFLNTAISSTGRELFATLPDCRHAMKEQITTRKLLPTTKTSAVYITTDVCEALHQEFQVYQVNQQLVVVKDSHALQTIRLIIEGLHKVECLLNPGSQIVSMSEAVWRYLKKGLNPEFKITMQSANGSLNTSFGIMENLELNISSIKLYVQAHIIKDPAYNILLGRPFNILTASTIQNHCNTTADVTIHNPNSDKITKILTQPRGQPRFKLLQPIDQSF